MSCGGTTYTTTPADPLVFGMLFCLASFIFGLVIVGENAQHFYGDANQLRLYQWSIIVVITSFLGFLCVGALMEDRSDAKKRIAQLEVQLEQRGIQYPQIESGEISLAKLMQRSMLRIRGIIVLPCV